MFCEKCGNKANEGEKFCEKCGAPLNASPEQVETPVNEQPVAQVQTEAQTEVQTEAQTVAQPEAVKAPKKPMSKKTKKIILFSSIGAAFVAVVLTVLFVFIIPMMNRIDPSQFIKFKFGEEILFDGYLSANVTVDSEKIYIEKVSGANSAEANSAEMIENLMKGNYGAITKSPSSVSSILEYCDVSATVKGSEEDSTAESTTINLSSLSAKKDIHTYAKLNNLKSDDTVVVKLSWDNSELSKNSISIMEKSLGVSFDKSDKTVEFKVSDMLEKEGVATKEPVNVDLFKYIDDNNIAYSKGIRDGYIKFGFKDFNFEQGGCTFKYTNDDGFKVINSDGKKINLYLDFSDKSYLDNGESVTVKLNTYNYNDSLPEGYVPETSIIFTETEKSYTVKANEPLTVDDAKKNLEAIKTTATTEINDYGFGSRDADIQEVYFLEAKSSSDSTKNMVLVIYKDKNNSNKYGIHYFTNTYMFDGELNFDDDSSEYVYSSNGKSLKDVEKGSRYLNNSYYTATKVS